MQARELEKWVYIRGEQWKKKFRYSLVDEYRKCISKSKDEIITAFEMPNRWRARKQEHYAQAAIELAKAESRMDLMLMPYEDKVQDTVNSYLGMLRHMNGFRLREWLCDAVAGSSLGLVLEPSANCEKVTIRPMYTKKNYYLNECKKLKQSLKLAS